MAARTYRHHKVTASLEQAKRAFYVGDEEVEEVDSVVSGLPDAAEVIEVITRLSPGRAHDYLGSLYRQHMPGVVKYLGTERTTYLLTHPDQIAAAKAHWAKDPEGHRIAKGKAGICQEHGCNSFPVTATPLGLLCNECLTKHGIPIPKIEQPVPMTAEEIARRRAVREAEKRTRRWDGGEIKWDRSKPLTLRVPYKGEDGRTALKMVGKLELVNMAVVEAMQAGREDWEESRKLPLEPVFFHAHLPSQRHHQTNSPSPVDTVVCDFLYRQGVDWIVAFERQSQGEGILRYAPTGRVQGAPEAEYDGRWRHYLPEESWTLLTGVNETLHHGGTRYYTRGKRGEVLIVSPFANEKDGVTLKSGRA